MILRGLQGKILRIRPGPLANFSGAAGYMPFIVMVSVPASVLLGILSSLILHFRGKHLLTSDNNPKTALHEFLRYAWGHTKVCVAIACVLGVLLLIYGQSMLYTDDKLKYVLLTVVFAVGPLVAWILSTFALLFLMRRRGAKWTNLLIATLLHLVLLAACIPVLLLVSAITGAQI